MDIYIEFFFLFKYVMKFFLLKMTRGPGCAGQIKGASLWRVFYRWGLPYIQYYYNLNFTLIHLKPVHLGPQTSDLRPQTSDLKPVHLRPQTSVLRPSTCPPQTSALSPQTSDLRPQTSDLGPHTSYLRPQTSLLCPPPQTYHPLPGLSDHTHHSGDAGGFKEPVEFLSRYQLIFQEPFWHVMSV